MILAQAEKPHFLFIVMKGMCKVLKRPNQSEVIERKIAELKSKAARLQIHLSPWTTAFAGQR